MKRSLQNNLDDAGFMEIVPENKVERVFKQRELVPLPEKPQQLGVRLGANYLINTNILEFNVNRSPSFAIPYLIRFPQTTFSLSASSSVTNMVTGETHPLGVISADVTKARGVDFFSTGPSSDIIYISEPERRVLEKKLIDDWVDEFNKVMSKKIRIFGWEPKRTEMEGVEETEG